MDKNQLRQISNKLKKSFENWDFQKAIRFSDGETQTRDFLIEPFFKILEYSEMDDYIHEFIADVGDNKGKKVDMAINLGGRNPDILVECKKATSKLTDSNYRQLNEYCLYVKEAKVGILTNGIVYEFYTRSSDSNTILHQKPFFRFDITNYDNADLEMLALFYRPTINVNYIIDEASEIYFLYKFDEALFKTLNKPSVEFIKIVYSNMGGKRMSDKINEKIFNLINSLSLQSVIDKIVKEEALSSKSGVITTVDELKAYNIVKTIMAVSNKIKNTDLERISYRDFKGFFAVLIDNNQRKGVCYFNLNSSKKSINIGYNNYNLDEISAIEITKYKKELVDSALKYL